MEEMYKKIDDLCKNQGIKIGKLASVTGISRGTLTDLKMGRTKSLSNETIIKISKYFCVPNSFFLSQKPFTQWEKLKDYKVKVLEVLAQWGNDDEYAKFLTGISDDIEYINIVNAWLDDIAFNDLDEIVIYPRLSKENMHNSINEIIIRSKKNKPATERDKLISESINLFEQLPTDKKQQALDYLRYLVEHQEKE